MNWKWKALIMKLFAGVPAGEQMYKVLQKRFGNLNADPASRISAQEKMTSWLADREISIPGSVVLEVGTGHKPVIPICFALMGARRVYTVDLHRRQDEGLLQGMLRRFASSRDQLIRSWSRYVPEEMVRQRFAVLLRHQDNPQLFFTKIGIHYLAPADAGSLALPDESVDCHLSNTVMEHISPEAIRRIMLEAKRLLKKNGVAIHFIDLSDHFQHQDSAITPLNFLRYTEKQWQRLAGNQFAYTNRLRPPDYYAIFQDLGFQIMRKEVNTYDAPLDFALPADSCFRAYADHDLRATELNILLERGR
jgi:SAM-dependent methyltransferase